MKLNKSLENRGVLLKGASTKITRQEGAFLNFLRPLMTTGSSLMKVVLTPLTQQHQQQIQLFKRKFMDQVQQY